MQVGVHVSISGSIDRAVDNAMTLKCTAFQIFTRSPRGWAAKDLAKEEVENFKAKLVSSKIDPYAICAHMPYLPNLSCPKKMLYNKSVKSLIVELDRCGTLGIPYLVTHLGSHLGKGLDIGLERIVAAFNLALSESNSYVMLLLENMAGQKNSMGSSFEDIKRILNGIEKKDRAGLCFDTAHAYAAGYDLRTSRGVKETLQKFDATLGLGWMKVVHLNDSQGGLGSGRDRHEHIGMGYIGEEGFRTLFKHETICKLPCIMETPIDERRDDRGNIRKVRELSA